jgi:hypothetical protein
MQNVECGASDYVNFFFYSEIRIDYSGMSPATTSRVITSSPVLVSS